MSDVTKCDTAVEGAPVDGCAGTGTDAGVQAAASAGDAPVVQIRGLHKAYGGNEVLRGIDLDVHRGEVVVVLGAFRCTRWKLPISAVLLILT